MGQSWGPSLLPRYMKSHLRKLLSGQESEHTSTRLLLPRPLIQRWLPPQIRTCQFLSQEKRKMQLLPRLQLVQGALAEVAERLKEYPAEWDDQQVEDRVKLKSLADTRLYEPNDSRLP